MKRLSPGQPVRLIRNRRQKGSDAAAQCARGAVVGGAVTTGGGGGAAVGAGVTGGATVVATVVSGARVVLGRSPDVVTALTDEDVGFEVAVPPLSLVAGPASPPPLPQAASRHDTAAAAKASRPRPISSPSASLSPAAEASAWNPSDVLWRQRTAAPPGAP